MINQMAAENKVTFVMQFCLEFQWQLHLFKIMKVHLKKQAKDECVTDANPNSTVARLRQEKYLLHTFIFHQPGPCLDHSQ